MDSGHIRDAFPAAAELAAHADTLVFGRVFDAFSWREPVLAGVFGHAAFSISMTLRVAHAMA